MDSIRFKLYIAGQTPRSHRAIANLRDLGTRELGDHYELEIIDVVEDPGAAEAARILTTPTLVKESPLPPRRVTGDLSDGPKVLYSLALTPGLDITPHAEDVG